MPARTEAQGLQSGSKLTFMAPDLPHKIPDLCMYEWAQNWKTQGWTKEFNFLVSVRGKKKGGWRAKVCPIQTNNPESHEFRHFYLHAQFYFEYVFKIIILMKWGAFYLPDIWILQECHGFKMRLFTSLFGFLSYDSIRSISDTVSSSDTGVFISFGSYCYALDDISPRSPSCSR